MKRVKKFLRRRGRLAAGVHAAMMVVASGKAATINGVKAEPFSMAILHKKKALPGIEELTGKTAQDAKQVALIANNIWDMAAEISESRQPGRQSVIDPTLTTDQARLWLQSYNAGPYALLKYKGHVPYRETQNYAPRVFKYYKEDLSKTEYEPFIQASAVKYGLDPQMIRAIMKTESSFNNSTVSHAGASGLMQVMPVVWKDIKARYNLQWDYTSGVFEPQKNIEVACAYLAWLRYDFLPRHFAEFEQNPTVPESLVRDNAPPRKTPRILASSISPAEAIASVATASPAAATKIVAAAASVTAPPSAESRNETVKKAPGVSDHKEPTKVTISKATKTAAKGGNQVASASKVRRTARPASAVAVAQARTSTKAASTSPIVAVPASKITTAKSRVAGIQRAAVNPNQVKVASAPARTLPVGPKLPAVSGGGKTAAKVSERVPIAVPSSKVTKIPSVADAKLGKPNSLQLMRQKRS